MVQACRCSTEKEPSKTEIFMSLRIRLFLLLGGLVALLAALQWWWIQGLTGDLYDELDEVAVTVGRSVASIIVAGSRVGMDFLHTDCTPKPCPEGSPLMDVFQFHTADSPAEEEDSPATVTHRKMKFVYSEDLQGTTAEQGIVRPQGNVEVKAEFDPSSHRMLHIEHKGESRFLSLPGHRLPIPQEGMRERLKIFSRQMLFGTLAFLVAGLLLAGLVAHRVSAPLRQLSAAAHQVGEGALGTRAPVPTSGGEVAQTITAFNQMSERLAILDAKTRELHINQHLGEIGEIARGLAHTLRNPLNALGLSVEELATRACAEEPDNPAHGLAESARRQIRRIDHSIRSFLALASQGGGATGPVQLTSLVQDVALEAIQDSQGQVRLQLDGMETVHTLNAVEPELRAVVQALLVNAIEASPQGAVVTVRLTQRAGERLLLEIEDDGPGLSEAVRSRLFTPHLTTKANGSGMGLFLAHRIATNRYSGSLELHDRANGGTRAVLEIGERIGGSVE
jgi:signal transduction histidine kinase